MTGGAGIRPVTIRAAGPVPSRVALASEQFSGLIDFLLPHARRDYADLDTATLARYLDAFTLPTRWPMPGLPICASTATPAENSSNSLAVWDRLAHRQRPSQRRCG